MKLDEIVEWYQKKIGTYDKQQWEKTVEQKILAGFSSVTLKTTKLKTELIDVDLVRGSTFPKAKPKQSLLTVIRLAIQRYFLLPIFANWWVKQTSPRAFALLLCLYLMQMINWAIFTYNKNHTICKSENALKLNKTNELGVQHAKGAKEVIGEHVVSLSDLLIPMALGLLLSLIHSQIVATNTATGIKSKRRRFSNASSIGSRIKREPKLRRRKKFVKNRSQEYCDAATQYRKSLQGSKLSGNVETIKLHTNTSKNIDAMPNNAPKCSLSDLIYDTRKPFTIWPAPIEIDSNSRDCDHDNQLDCSLLNKKRSVNWHSPIHNYAIEKLEKQQQTSPQSQSVSTATSASETNTPSAISNGADNDENASQRCTASHRSSNTSSTTTNSNNVSPIKTVRIDERVEEVHDDCVQPANRRTQNSQPVKANILWPLPAIPTTGRNIFEDDGFESLNGKSSSGDEVNASQSATNNNGIMRSKLRLLLDVLSTEDNLEIESTTMPPTFRPKFPLSSESDIERTQPQQCQQQNPSTQKYRTSVLTASNDDITTDHSDEDEMETALRSTSLSSNANYNEGTTSATEWLGITTNSEECSYSEFEDTDDNFNKNQQYNDEDGYEMDYVPATMLNPHGSTDRISCTFWEQNDIKKAQLSVLEISSCIIERVESMPETKDYIYLGVAFSFLLSFIPTFCRLCEVTLDSDSELDYWSLPILLWERAFYSYDALIDFAFGQKNWERTLLILAFIQRFALTLILFLIFSVAERTFKQRFLYAKLFSHLTSSRRARKSNLPHFRLNKVRNIKTWLCVRSYLKKRGPQRSVDIIVSASFILTLLLVAFLSVEWLKDSSNAHSQLNFEALMWSIGIGFFLLRFMTLGNKISQKYRSVSVLITEQINLYLQIEQKPKKKDELMVSNNVLKLATDLLKELESPFKISGLCANPYLFTTIKVVVLSALSGVLSEMLGFKLKLHKIKIK